MDTSTASVEESPGPEALSEDVRRRFLAIVILLNVGILTVSLGLMLAGFRGRYRDAALLVAGGGIVLASAYRRYRTRHEVFESSA
ncbi:putative membrane protein [Halanaeroarchaeum sp. HSR-CO]|nr:putative membrane protein [Halanaeroarchaeum sp. HSR-CO]